jgi:hypothetical protein
MAQPSGAFYPISFLFSLFEATYFAIELVAALSMSRWTSGAFPEGTYMTITM